jgi:hypothetical protein
MQEKKGKDFILVRFCVILNFEVGRKSTSFLISNGLQAREGGSGAGQIYAYTSANSQVP